MTDDGAKPAVLRCARCGKLIVSTVIKCPECGIHFQGEAQDFVHPSEQARGRNGMSLWVMAVAVLLLAAMAVGLISLK